MSLLNTDALKILHGSLKLTSDLGLFPFQVNIKTRHCTVVNSYHYQLHFVANCILQVFTELCLIGFVAIAYKLVLASKISESVLFLCIFLTIIFPLTLALDITHYKWRYEMMQCCNACIHLVDDIYNVTHRAKDMEDEQDIYNDNKMIQKRQQIFKLLKTILLLITPLCVIFVPFTTWNDALVIAQDIINIITIFVEIKIPFWFVICAFILGFIPIYIYLTICVLSRFYCVSVFAITVVWTAQYILQNKISLQLTSNDDHEYSSWTRSLRNPMNGVKIYKRMFLLVNLINIIFSWMSALAITVFMLACSFQLYFISGYNGSLYVRLVLLIGFCNMVVALTYIIHMCGRIHVISTVLLSSWDRSRNVKDLGIKGKKLRDIQIKHFKALQPLKFMVGSTHFLYEKSALICWHFIIDKTITLLYCFPFKNTNVKYNQ